MRFSRKWLLLLAPIAIALLAAGWWWNSREQFEITPPPSPPPDFDAYCTHGKIERVKAVHFLPGRFGKRVEIGKLDPQFVSHARFLLDKFWDGELAMVATENAGLMLPLSEREMTLVISESEEGGWEAAVFLYNRLQLMPTLDSTSRKNNKIEDIIKANENYRKELSQYNGLISMGLYNKSTNWKTVNLSGKLHRNLRNKEYEPDLFYRSLHDLVKGKCDRLMSEAVNGPEKEGRKDLPVGNFHVE